MDKVTANWKTVTSMVGTVLFIRSMIPDEVERIIRSHIYRHVMKLLTIDESSKTAIFYINELDSMGCRNKLFESVEVYVGSKCIASANTSFTLTKITDSETISKFLVPGQVVVDTFDGVKVQWVPVQRDQNQSQSDHSYTSRQYKLKFDKKHTVKIESRYLPFLVDEAQRIKATNTQCKLFTNSMGRGFDGGRGWCSVPFLHPATFDTLAIDPVLKEIIKQDLNKFLASENYYKKLGRTWKRGYLLYGPPGTGKTSLIAAIANFLHFDIYDLELTAVVDNSQLRRLLSLTSKKSIIVIEDVDCSVDLSDRKRNVRIRRQDGSQGEGSEISLSGVLNFLDGLWSSCGGERLIILTTNHKDRLDPALLRAGRMDWHILMSYCQFPAFKILARNYLGVEGTHQLMPEVERLLSLIEITPADIAEIFMGVDPDVGMLRVLKEMNKRLIVVNERRPRVKSLFISGDLGYSGKQNATPVSSEDIVDSLNSSHVIDVEQAHEGETKNGRELKIYDSINFLLLVCKIYATVRSGSLAIVASTLASMLVMFASILQCKCLSKPVDIIVFLAVMASLGSLVMIHAVEQLIKNYPSEKMTSEQLMWLLGILLATAGAKLVHWIYCRRQGNKIVHSHAKDHYVEVLMNIAGLVAAIVGHKFCWWIDPIGAIIVVAYMVSYWSRTVLKI